MLTCKAQRKVLNGFIFGYAFVLSWEFVKLGIVKNGYVSSVKGK